MKDAFAAGWNCALGELVKVLLDVHGGPGRLMSVKLWDEIREIIASLKCGADKKNPELVNALHAYMSQSGPPQQLAQDEPGWETKARGRRPRHPGRDDSRDETDKWYPPE